MEGRKTLVWLQDDVYRIPLEFQNHVRNCGAINQNISSDESHKVLPTTKHIKQI
jgi:hypothetical protein